MGYTSYLEKYEIIRVTPTLSTDAYAAGDVAFTATEIPNAVINEGGCSKIINCFVIDQDRDTFDLNLVFTEKNTALGTINATADISDANMVLNKVTGITKLEGTAGNDGGDFDNFRIHRMIGASGANENMDNLTFIKAANGSTSSYLHCHLTAVDGSTNPTFTASQLEIILHIEY